MIDDRLLAAHIVRVTGVVQGVGFRPFVHRLAIRHGLAGWVRNVAGAVEIHVEGDGAEVDAFESQLRSEAPDVARIDTLVASVIEKGTLGGVSGEFRIEASISADGDRPVPSDFATCAACASELLDPADRRYRHPFITCTHCGPRYTVIRSLPYDRERTSMAGFAMCARCAAEYADATDRRFHAETVACPDCGPRVWLERGDGRVASRDDTAIRDTAALLCVGRIVAIRGVGGFHLACDATDVVAVNMLRARKRRRGKPFAVMVRTLGDARALATVSDAEAALLSGAEHPVVLLLRRADAALAPGVAPGLDRVGVMLAYSPIHHLLLDAVGRPLVMTSGNLSDEPIAIGNDEARTRLNGVADAFLLHDREIISRVDDSVVRLVDGHAVLLRRARGYAPRTVRLPIPSPHPLIAVGAHLKNTFSLVRGAFAWVSPHIGDLDGLEAHDHFLATLARYQELFQIVPAVAVCDQHPGYLSTAIADSLGFARTIEVQHHHAHIAAVAAEHGVTESVVGLAFDGTGHGDDGCAWGAEVLVADMRGYRRAGQLRYAPMPGGDLAMREPWRAALGYLSLDPGAAAGFALAFEGVDEARREIATRQVERRLNAPLASSMGRLFDAAAAVLGVRRVSEHEGQAAMELESLAGTFPAEPLPFPIDDSGGRLVLDPVPLLAALGELRRCGVDVAILAAQFHESVIRSAAEVAERVAHTAGVGIVALGGGSFQNARLLAGIRSRLETAGFRVLVPRQLGPNDGAISYGQAAVAAALLARER